MESVTCNHFSICTISIWATHSFYRPLHYYYCYLSLAVSSSVIFLMFLNITVYRSTWEILCRHAHIQYLFFKSLNDTENLQELHPLIKLSLRYYLEHMLSSEMNNYKRVEVNEKFKKTLTWLYPMQEFFFIHILCSYIHT